MLILGSILNGLSISYMANPSDCIILDKWVFEILADEPFATTLQTFQTCVSVKYNLCRKLVARRS